VTGNHIADQADKAREQAGMCPACGKGITEPADWCPEYSIECFPSHCLAGEKCGQMVPAVRCPRCGWIKKEE
jgi:hypothetical protein